MSLRFFDLTRGFAGKKFKTTWFWGKILSTNAKIFFHIRKNIGSNRPRVYSKVIFTILGQIAQSIISYYLFICHTKLIQRNIIEFDIFCSFSKTFIVSNIELTNPTRVWTVYPVYSDHFSPFPSSFALYLYFMILLYKKLWNIRIFKFHPRQARNSLNSRISWHTKHLESKYFIFFCISHGEVESFQP